MLEAYAHHLEPEWRDNNQTVYSIGKYENTYKWLETIKGSRVLGTVYMSKDTAEQICDKLNSGKIIL